MTYLCVPIFVRTLDQTRHDLSAAVEAGAEMIELRLDTLSDARLLPQIIEAARTCRLTWIATCRPIAEGGHSAKSDEARFDLLLQAGRSASYVDWELATPGPAPRLQEISKVILSSHDFSGRPERLYNLLLEMDKSACEVRKIAWKARTIRDNAEAFEILQQAQKPTIALCMGEAGAISRILAKKFGAFLTFASLQNESATAPGQISIADMKGIYRWDKIKRGTKVYGVVANPVGHSMSPAIHNAAFEA
ncbi:MAG TPA: type I 3-dehydroquinate dehydratase, partial [Tepidisphaeraceae bacterium]|nr:type I 3-dehydroquinate dehydratase [Tepidisphaeraceae bacterium]